MEDLELECIELHLSAEPLQRKHRDAIRACAGSYSKCLGYQSKRFVLVPYTERALIDALVRTYGMLHRTAMIGRTKGYDSRPAWVVVHWVDRDASIPPLMQFEQKYRLAVMDAQRRGIYPYTKQEA